MGAITSKPEDVGSVYMGDRSRFSVSSVHISTRYGQTLLHIASSADKCSLVVVREEESPMVEFVQDIEPQSITPILLKLPSENGLVFTFKAVLNAETATNFALNGLTFMSSTSKTALDSTLTKELQSDPNIQNRDNVIFIGDVVTPEAKPVEMEWTWMWHPPCDAHPKFNGWRNACCFAEYSKRDHKLTMLMRFSFWVSDAPKLLRPVTITPELTTAERFANFGDESPGNEAVPPSLLVTSASLLSDQATTPKLIGRSSSAVIPSSSSSSLVARPVIDDQSQPEDGPLFRATISSLEKKTSGLKATIKKTLKSAARVYEAQQEYGDNLAVFLTNLRDTAKVLPSIRPVVDDYFALVGREFLLFERNSCMDLQKFIIEPLRRLYDVEIKTADSKKRDFDEDSREYYAWLSRYLSMKQEVKGKKKSESDVKYQDKRKNFELKRFDYYSYMQDLHGGRKEQEMAFQLSAYASSIMNRFDFTCTRIQLNKKQVDEMISTMKENREAWIRRRQDREERRRALERSAMPEPGASSSILGSSDNGGHHRRQLSEGIRGHMGKFQLPPLRTTMYNGTKDVPLPSLPLKDVNEGALSMDTGRRKEGLLWAMSRPEGHNDPRNLNKLGWHKFWVVLAGGQLYEYTNWKQSLELHNEPVDLKMATVREARSAERRFCFEVITPHYRRMYQATSEDDMMSWINVITNAISSTIEGTNSPTTPYTVDPSTAGTTPLGGDLKVSKLQSSLGSANRLGASPKVLKPGMRPNEGPSSDEDTMDGGMLKWTVSADSTASQSSTVREPTESLMRRLREADAANSICADCGGQAKVEWVSINLMVILCIECSGLHRSLGTHISKIRSLTLDTTSFTPDLVDALLAIGNKNANSVWEAQPAAETAKTTMKRMIHVQQQQTQLQQHQNVLSQSPANGVGSTGSTPIVRQARLDYITRKYVGREFVSPVAQADAALRNAVKKQDIVEVLRALACGANPNGNSGAGSTPISSLSSSSSSTSLSSTSSVALPSLPPTSNGDRAYSIFMAALVFAPRDTRTFPVMEVLLQNGMTIPREVPPEIRLPPFAAEYLGRRGAGRGKAEGGNGASMYDPITPSSTSSSSSLPISVMPPASSTLLPGAMASAPQTSSMLSSTSASAASLLDQANSRFQRKLSIGSPRLHHQHGNGAK
ncbi:uncharacterized protein V1518DRAFT_421282 [Limtongia smithiae]|uniref:uncharacterized protein n=1 Tax=Limtongia smithiae TaxID=1125753 RepID=UPI0034CD6A6D